jgi:class 3 adenylate cyclase
MMAGQSAVRIGIHSGDILFLASVYGNGVNISRIESFALQVLFYLQEFSMK